MISTQSSRQMSKMESEIVDYSKCGVCDTPTPDKSGLCAEHYKALITPLFPKTDRDANKKIAKMRKEFQLESANALREQGEKK